jgi:beta-glucanase (GH16 family)
VVTDKDRVTPVRNRGRKIASTMIPLLCLTIAACQGQSPGQGAAAVAPTVNTPAGSPTGVAVTVPPTSADATPPSVTTTELSASKSKKNPTKPEPKTGTETTPPTSPGWTQTFYDDFNDDRLDTSVWGPYDGKPANDTISLWSPSQVFLQDGKLVLRSSYADGRWTTGGIGQKTTQQYGKWLVRYRVEPGKGVLYVLLLYPSGGGWPPEIDFAEDHGGGERGSIMGVTHWGAENHQIIKVKKADFSQWHTAGVIIEPGKVSYLLDGKVWGTVTGAQKAPSDPMWLGIQTQVNSCLGPNCKAAGTPGTVDLEVDWVARYSRT